MLALDMPPLYLQKGVVSFLHLGVEVGAEREKQNTAT